MELSGRKRKRKYCCDVVMERKRVGNMRIDGPHKRRVIKLRKLDDMIPRMRVSVRS